MYSPLLTLVFVGLGFFSSLFAPLVQSQGNVNPETESLSPPPPPPSPPPPPPPSPSSPPPPSPPPPPLKFSPPLYPASPPPAPSGLSPPLPRPPYPPSSPRRPPPRRSPPHATARSLPPPNHNGLSDSRRQKSFAKSRPPSKQKLNLGKKIGLIFLGIVVIMQVGVVAFLVAMRRQLLKSNDRY